jgi:hypothetical protein
MAVGLASLASAALLGFGPAAPAGEPCHEHGARQLVTRFISAFNRGDSRSLDAVFARGMAWRWYSVGTAPGKRVGGPAYNRSTLLKYFRARHKKNERLELQYFSFNGVSDGFGHFEYEVVRRADDMRAPRRKLYHGKGAVSCWAGKLGVLSMGEAS